MYKILFVLIMLVLAGGVVDAQLETDTPTPTNTPTETLTPTPTYTPTPDVVLYLDFDAGEGESQATRFDYVITAGDVGIMLFLFIQTALLVAFFTLTRRGNHRE